MMRRSKRLVTAMVAGNALREVVGVNLLCFSVAQGRCRMLRHKDALAAKQEGVVLGGVIKVVKQLRGARIAVNRRVMHCAAQHRRVVLGDIQFCFLSDGREPLQNGQTACRPCSRFKRWRGLDPNYHIQVKRVVALESEDARFAPELRLAIAFEELSATLSSKIFAFACNFESHLEVTHELLARCLVVSLETFHLLAVEVGVARGYKRGHHGKRWNFDAATGTVVSQGPRNHEIWQCPMTALVIMPTAMLNASRVTVSSID
eukprot:6209079-Pleurochrysis_carterae.AAC.7